MISFAFAHVSLISLASERGVALSSAPVISSRGALISESLSVISKSRTAIVAAMYPSIGVLATIVRISLTIEGCIAGKPSAYQRASSSVNIDSKP